MTSNEVKHQAKMQEWGLAIGRVKIFSHFSLQALA